MADLSKPGTGWAASGNQADNRFEIAMRGGKKKVYYEILSRYKNGESLEHIKNVAQRSVKALDKQINALGQVNTLSMALASDDIELLLDCINAQMTEAKWKKNPKRGEAVYELYQTIGQALGEADIRLQFRVTDLQPSDVPSQDNGHDKAQTPQTNHKGEV